VARLEDAVEHFKSSNFHPVAAPRTSHRVGMRRIVFLASATFTLIELIESR